MGNAGVENRRGCIKIRANDFGSTMIEENVVASAGVSYRVSKEDIVRAIKMPDSHLHREIPVTTS